MQLAIDLLIELSDFKFVTILVLEFKKIENMIKQNITPLILIQKQKQLLMKVILIIHLNHSIVLLYQK